MKPPSRRNSRKSAASTARELAVVTADGISHQEEITKQDLVQRTGLSTRDLRVVDLVLSYPSSILGRERAIVINLEHIKAIVTASEVLLSTREILWSNPCGESWNQGLLETLALEKEAYPALDELTHNVSTLNLERVRQIKSRLVGISSRMQKIRDELEHLLDDDVDMAFLHLSEKLLYQASLGQPSRSDFYKHPPQSDEESDIGYYEKDAIESELEEKDDENENKTVIGFKPNLDELEMLLEAYFVQSEGILNKLTTLRDYVDDTEDYINIMLDDKQNQLLQRE